MRAGAPIGTPPGMDAIRERVRAELDTLPDGLRALDRHGEYPVEIAPALIALAARVDAEFH